MKPARPPSVGKLMEHANILTALRHLKGRATVGDVVAATGLPADDARAGLKALLEGRRGHLAVSERGELVYEFHPRLLERDREPLLARLQRGAWGFFKKAFKAATVIVLVVYFIIFVALVLAAI
ncbi:MAG: hypothetical protein FIA95_15980, partial [Gemmatimonadetes bacterium]|nr:hypothetical protein [Gemmatimonadota bacterium]